MSEKKIGPIDGLTADDRIEFDCELVDGRIVRRSGRIVYADGRVEQLRLRASEWKPIESAPKLKEVLIVFPSGHVRIGQLCAGDASHPLLWRDSGGSILSRPWHDDERPTHWMPLPDPPHAPPKPLPVSGVITGEQGHFREPEG